MSSKLMEHLKELTTMKKEGYLSESEFRDLKAKLIAMSNDELQQQPSSSRAAAGLPANSTAQSRRERRRSSNNTNGSSNPSPNTSVSGSPGSDNHPHGSWKCRSCGNINWPMRSFCNRKSCQRPRDPEHKDVIVPFPEAPGSDRGDGFDSSPVETHSKSPVIEPTASSAPLPIPDDEIKRSSGESRGLPGNATASRSSSSDGEVQDLQFKIGSLQSSYGNTATSGSMFEGQYPPPPQQSPQPTQTVFMGQPPAARQQQAPDLTFGQVYSSSAPPSMGSSLFPSQPNLLPPHLQHLEDIMQPKGSSGYDVWQQQQPVAGQQQQWWPQA